jgi:DNA-binding HxlR family transcriptional regulator
VERRLVDLVEDRDRQVGVGERSGVRQHLRAADPVSPGALGPTVEDDRRRGDDQPVDVRRRAPQNLESGCMAERERPAVGGEPLGVVNGDSGRDLVCLENGPRRFSELRVPLHRVAPKALTETLRALERDGFVTRTVFAENPPRVEYELTPLARTLLGPIDACREWAKANLPLLLEARDDYEFGTNAA